MTALALGLAGAGAGCGGAASDGSGAAPTSAPRPSAAALKRQQEALHRQVAESLKHVSHDRYGKLPAALASRQGDPKRILVATPGRPARTTQGAKVTVRLPGGRGVATAVGPAIPLDLEGTSARTAPARFTVTFTGLHGAVPLRKGTFGVLDEAGVVHVPPVQVRRRGSSARVSVRVTLPTGDGRIVYAPAGKPLVTWDYTLETD